MQHDTERVKMDDRDYKIRCLQCDRWFEATRSDATFCSARCRVAYGREAEKLDHFMTWLNRVSEGILTGAQTYKRNKAVFALMQLVQKDVNAAVGLFESD